MTESREIVSKLFEDEFEGTIDGTDFANNVISNLHAAGFRIISKDEFADIKRVVEIANRNEWSEEGNRLARAIGMKVMRLSKSQQRVLHLLTKSSGQHTARELGTVTCESLRVRGLVDGDRPYRGAPNDERLVSITPAGRQALASKGGER